MFAAVVMGYLERIFGGEILNDADIAARAGELRRTITEGIEAHAKTTNRNGETIYAFETDGLGHVNIMDDSNVPSLMAAPYLGYCAPDDPTYLATRRTLLSDENPYYYEGEYLKGIGSPHTPPRYVWPIALSIEAMTSDSRISRRIFSTVSWPPTPVRISCTKASTWMIRPSTRANGSAGRI